MKKLIIILGILILVLIVGEKTGFLPTVSNPKNPPDVQTKTYELGSEESVITKVVEESLPSVVTVGIRKVTTTSDSFQFNPLNPFQPFQQVPGQTQKIEQNIGSGFVISENGLIITNKHVVSDTQSSYQILTNDKKKYDVTKIYRDPLNDLAILKINATGLRPLKLGDSSHLKLGQLAIAIGTPLGQFTNTVTSGIVSGLGRGITAGSPFEGFVEKLDNVIQTDAAISPGNSGGPLLNSNGQVIGVNTALAQEGQNLGFAIPVNLVKEIIDNFNKHGGTFERPYIGVRYKMIDKQTAVLNDLVQGAYIVQVIQNSPADKAGLQDEDIIIEFDGKKITGDTDQALTLLLDNKRIGDVVQLKIWRNGNIMNKNLTLEAAQ